MSGVVKEGDDLTNADRGSKERMAQLFVCAGSNREKGRKTRGGRHRLHCETEGCQDGQHLKQQVATIVLILSNIQIRNIRVPSRPVNEGRHGKDDGGIKPYVRKDPTWVVEQSKELRQILVHGQGEFHLRTLKWRLENLDKIPVEFTSSASPIVKPSRRLHAPTIAIRSRAAELVSLVRYTS